MPWQLIFLLFEVHSATIRSNVHNHRSSSHVIKGKANDESIERIPSGDTLIKRKNSGLSNLPTKENENLFNPTENGRGRHCFAADGDDLREAVHVFLDQNASTADSHMLEVIQERYGERMESWCVDQVEDFSHVFESQRNFNLDLSGWNVGNGRDFDYMFHGTTAFNQNLCSWKSRLMESAINKQLNQDGLQFQFKGMFESSGCLNTSSPSLVYDSSHAWKFNFVGSFCHPCTEAMQDVRSDPSQLDMTVSAGSREPFGRGDHNTTNEEELLLATITSVHSHEATAKGAQLVLGLMLLVCFMNGLSSGVLKRASNTTDETSIGRQRHRKLRYTQLATNNNFDEVEDKSDDQMVEQDTELAKIVPETKPIE